MAGSVVLFNDQVWHRGGPNRSRANAVHYPGRLRAAGNWTQVLSIMNYQMPTHVYQDANPLLLRLLGFLPHGAYG